MSILLINKAKRKYTQINIVRKTAISIRIKDVFKFFLGKVSYLYKIKYGIALFYRKFNIENELFLQKTSGGCSN
jgi:hypothetical protein